MKNVVALVFAMLVAAVPALAFSGSSSFGGSQMARVAASSTVTMEYIPSGISKEQWKKMKEEEAKKRAQRNLGKTGITSFKSRSFAEWQKSGGKNLFPVDPRSVKDPSEIPYMQRPGGKPDDSDIKKGGGFNLFGAFGKKKEPEPEPVEEKKKNWWSL